MRWVRWSWQACQLASCSTLKTYVQMIFTESYIYLLFCHHHRFVRHLLPNTNLLHVGCICQSLLTKDTWIEMVTSGRDLCTLVCPEVVTCFIQMILSGALFWFLFGWGFFCLFSTLQLRIHVSSFSFCLTGQGNNTCIFSVLVNINFIRNKKCFHWYSHSAPKFTWYYWRT